MAQEKEKPTVKTVQQEVTVSDLLMYEVCAPLKEQLDKIEICRPSIAVCMPNEFCAPTTRCGPSDWFVCAPRTGCEPRDPLVCAPKAGTSWDPGDLATSANLLKQKLVASDFERLQAEVEKLKKEIEALRSKK